MNNNDIIVQDVKNKAKQIIDNFSKALEKEKIKSLNKNRSTINDRRKEKIDNTKKVDLRFREILFQNAPKKNNEFIIAEKKHW